jgi:cohesin complex subunit SCC1
MFYSTNVLQKKGPLGTIWIAAHHDVAKRLTKLQILNTDIVKTAGKVKLRIPMFVRIWKVVLNEPNKSHCSCSGQIENPETEMSLRLSSHLLAGLSRIFTRKVQFLFTDCNEALSKITLVRSIRFLLEYLYSDVLIVFSGISTQ